MKRHELQNNLAMTVTLISGAMLFTTLFMGYAIYRTSADQWPPLGVGRVSLVLPTVSTLMILVSSWFAYQVRLNVKAQSFKDAKTNLNITLGLGIGFMLVQSLLWAYLKNVGLFASSGIFASILYAFTWIHAAHVVCGLGTLVFLRLVMKPERRHILQTTLNVEKFWHFLGIVWLVMYFGLFVF